MKLRIWLLCCIAVFSTDLCAAITVRDDAGATLTLARPAQRVISLAPDQTELLFAAGGAQHVVGVIRFSDYPEAATRLPVVGDVQGLDLERILSLKPDLIVVWGGGNATQQLLQLRKTGIALFVSQPRHLAAKDLFRRLKTLLSGQGSGAHTRLADLRPRAAA